MNQAAAFQHASWGFDVTQLHEILRKASRRPSSVDQSSRFRLNRISKPSSTGNSPRHSGPRRSTLAAGSCLHPTPIRQHHQPAASSDYLVDGTVIPKTRPISWHPSSFQQQESLSLAPSYHLPQASMPTYNFPSETFTTTQVNGLITPLSQPCFDDLFNAGLDEDPYAYLDEFRGTSIPDWADYSHFPDPAEHMKGNDPTNVGQGVQSSPLMKPKMETAPPSPDFLPLQEISPTKEAKDEPALLSKIESTTDDLVGMGLYDPPSSSNGMLFGNNIIGGSTGKGLKLEETFEPSINEEDDDEDDDEDEDGEGEDDDSKDQLQDSTQFHRGEISHPGQPSSNVANQSFLFDSGNPQLAPQSHSLVIPDISGGWV